MGVLIEWSTENTDKIVLDPDDLVLYGQRGRKVIFPAESKTYRLSVMRTDSMPVHSQTSSVVVLPERIDNITNWADPSIDVNFVVGPEFDEALYGTIESVQDEDGVVPVESDFESEAAKILFNAC